MTDLAVEPIDPPVAEVLTPGVLPEELLRRFHGRAPEYDRDNRFFSEDLDELREIGYLRAAIPVSHGGLGWTLPQFNSAQRALAYWAPATALGVNMHLYWTGPLADRIAAGDSSLDWLAHEVAAGKVIAAGHGERGNDLAIDDSTTIATRVEGGYRVTGHKIFTSLSPAWDWLGIHARDESDPDKPRIIHAFVPRHSEGVRTVETWDTLGVRATASHDTVLTNVFVAEEHVIDSYERGESPGPFISSILPWAIPALVNVYLGIGRRAVDVALESARTRNVLSLGDRPVAGKPYVRYHAAEAELALEAATAQLDHITERLARGDDFGDRLLLALFAVKESGTRTARTVVDLALEIGGGGSIHRRNELERLYRDVRAGSFHPPSSDSVREYIGNFLLGE
ncbi:acyl-CoA dehydrogenase family protein [Nocardia takedensis]|uniref:acyl-CoA dehydrogenase family protein n=1 Tax=Nocardia takedensis TaxID=259390 RepID=UPI0003150791|nr:acyl-CoA dehydrogenase family protein [Nocardia takedensis]